MKRVVIGIVGTVMDAGTGSDRWDRWRPTVDLCRHEDFVVDRIELLHQKKFQRLTRTVADDIAQVSPETEVRTHYIEHRDPWDFEEVFGVLHDFARGYPFRPEEEEYLVHMTTGTHVAQICLFLLTETRYIPAKLLQTSPPKRRRGQGSPGSYTIIDLDLSKYDRLAARFEDARRADLSSLKSGIDTRNDAFNRLIERIEQVAVASSAPLLLTGPTGAGKSQLARRIYDLKLSRRKVEGPFVEVNCATLRGDGAMSTLFGHVKGAFTGAVETRLGLLRTADGGMLFLDEIGELGLDEQAMLLRALEEKTFMPVGSDVEIRSDFQLIAGTNRDLAAAVADGRFRNDLLARINLWTFRLPALRERPEDIEPNLEYELGRCRREMGWNVSFNKEARQAFLRFATAKAALWPGNFRDFSAAITRMATLAQGGRIDGALVAEELERLHANWRPAAQGATESDAALRRHLPSDAIAELDRFDRVQLSEVLRVCEQARTLSDAGRALFDVSRTQRRTVNDADRLRKYLARFQLSWSDLVVRRLES